MGKTRFSAIEMSQLVKFRKRGYTIREISSLLGRSKATIAKRVSGVKVLPEHQAAWKSKRGGSAMRAQLRRISARTKAHKLVGSLTKRDLLLIATCLYWGEGNKREFNFINSDPKMINTFLNSLTQLGLKKKRIKVSIRVYEDVSVHKAKEFWSRVTGVSETVIQRIDVIKGNKFGKLPYGMCRIRISKGNDYFNLLSATVELISNHSPYSSMDRATDS